LLDTLLDIKTQRDRYSRQEIDLLSHDADSIW
jgi:hypothetical protein